MWSSFGHCSDTSSNADFPGFSHFELVSEATLSLQLLHFWKKSILMAVPSHLTPHKLDVVLSGSRLSATVRLLSSESESCLHEHLHPADFIVWMRLGAVSLYRGVRPWGLIFQKSFLKSGSFVRNFSENIENIYFIYIFIYIYIL